MTLVAGVDSSTQSCKLLVCDAQTGKVIRQGQAPHPPGTEINPESWWQALQLAIKEAGGLSDVSAVSIAGQQHGMVLLDSKGQIVRNALLWNDVRSAGAAESLIREVSTEHISGEDFWVERVGLVPVASFTASKLRWVAENEPHVMNRAAAVCLPHDWLSWKLAGCTRPSDLTTDPSDASGTGYFCPETGEYDFELLSLSTMGKSLTVPRVVGLGKVAHKTERFSIAGGMGDNAAAALGLGLLEGEVLISVGTSGVVTTLKSMQTKDSTGTVAGFASAQAETFLPLACTLNGAELFAKYAELLTISLDELSSLALSAPAGSDGIVTIPFFNGERTPNLPSSKAEISGLRLNNLSRPNLARSLFEGLLCALAEAMNRVAPASTGNVLLIGGAAKSPALRSIAPAVFGRKVVVPSPAEYVAIGAAKQAAMSMGLSVSGWNRDVDEIYVGGFEPLILDQYRSALHHFLNKYEDRQDLQVMAKSDIQN